MNKHIYYNQLRITIGAKSAENTQNQDLVIFDKNAPEKLNNAIALFLKDGNQRNLFIETDNFDELLKTLKNEFHFIEAAGGLIQNKDRYLFIKRLGKWDLPKGKLDKGETPEAAAARECEEECDVKDLNIIKALPSTYHIYEHKNRHVLKVTYWYYMQTNYDKPLKPQTEENIEEVKWFSIDEIKSIALKKTYITIEELVKDFFTL